MTAELPDAALPELPLAEVRAQIAAAESRLQAIDQQLRDLARALPRLTAWREDLAEGSELLTVRDGMGEAQTLLYLEGYVPARTLPELRAAAAAEGWGLRLETPADDDTNVPTLLRIPRWLQLSTPLLSFIGIQPGYREFDISACFLLFFSIFCGMIVGDAGYGLLMLVTTLIVRSRLQPEQRPAANLFLLLSGCVMTWGLLTGAFFGIPAAHLPFFMHGVPWCRELRNIQFLCFLLGAIHLTIAHGWKGLVTINSLSCLSHLGWTLIIWGNFFVGSHLVTERPYPSFGLYFYYVGVVLVLAFTDPSRKLLKSFGAGLSAILLGGMNSFVDVLSYIRLFAVGLSGAYMASSFNDMGLMVAGSPVGIVLMLGVFAFGHALNLALSALGVLVHGIRLNTLEFSGHIGIEWAGIPFHAFARRRGAAPDGTPGATTS